MNHASNRQIWEEGIGPLLQKEQVFQLTGWSEDSLLQAVKENQVIELVTTENETLYPKWQFDPENPSSPLPRLRDLIQLWKGVNSSQWSLAGWLSAPEPQLKNYIPRDLLKGDRADAVLLLARQDVARLAR